MKKDGKKRVWFLLIFCTAVFAAFLVRLYWMQFTMADHYAKKLEQASQTSYTVRIPAARGSIVTAAARRWCRMTLCMTWRSAFRPHRTPRWRRPCKR